MLISRQFLSGSISNIDWVLATAPVLEFFSVFAVFSFVRYSDRQFSQKEQNALLILATGMFTILGLALVGLDLAQPISSFDRIMLLVTVIYALVHLIINTRQSVSSSSQAIKMFLFGYGIPILVAAGLCLGIAVISETTLNAVALYYLIKNFTSATFS